MSIAGSTKKEFLFYPVGARLWKNDRSPLPGGSFLGVAFGPDSKTLYLSGGDKGNVVVYDAEKLQVIEILSLNGTVNGTVYEDSFTSDLVKGPGYG